MLSKINIFLDEKSILHVKGNINLYNCMFLKTKCISKIEKLNKIYINLKDLKNDDSAILLFIINIIRFSKPKKIYFVNLSISLKKLIKSYKMEKIFHEYSFN